MTAAMKPMMSGLMMVPALILMTTMMTLAMVIATTAVQGMVRPIAAHI